MNKKKFSHITAEINKLTLDRKYLIFLVIAITAIGINYYYSLTMMLLTTFILAYLTKGSRRK